MTHDDNPPLTRPLRLGTRGSPLALVQAHMVAAALRAAHGWGEDAIDIVTVRTDGDRIQDRPLADIGGKALWTKELDRALAEGVIDFAVHSMKDVETIRPEEIVIAAMLSRAEVQDRLIGAESVAALPKGGKVGTSSPRRAAKLLQLRPDLSIVLFRGNVARRLARLEAEEADATLLAAAGLIRLGEAGTGHDIPLNIMLPAPAQGAVGIETLAENASIRHLLAVIDDSDTSDCVRSERAFLLGLGAGCHSPVAALARIEDEGIFLKAEILSIDGTEHVAGAARFRRGDEEAAKMLASDLLKKASPALRALFTP